MQNFWKWGFDTLSHGMDLSMFFLVFFSLKRGRNNHRSKFSLNVSKLTTVNVIIDQVFRKIMNDKDITKKSLKNQQREYESSQGISIFPPTFFVYSHFSMSIFIITFLMCERSMLCSGFLCANDIPISSDIDLDYLIYKCVFLSHAPKPYATLILWLTENVSKKQMCSCTSCCFIEKQCERKEYKKCVDAVVSNVASVHVTGFMPNLSLKPKKISDLLGWIFVWLRSADIQMCICLCF